MRKKEQTQVIQWKHNKVPFSIKLGRVLLAIGAGLFLIGSVFSLIDWSLSLASHWVDFGPDWVGIITPLSFWNSPINIADVMGDAFNPIIYVAMFISGIGAISYLRDKGPFISWVAWAALIGLGIVFFDFVVNIRSLISEGFDWGAFALRLAFMQIDALVYSIGWFLAKNWLD